MPSSQAPNPARVTRHGAMTLTLSRDSEISSRACSTRQEAPRVRSRARPEHVRRRSGRGGTTMTSCEIDSDPAAKRGTVIQKAIGQPMPSAAMYRRSSRPTVRPDVRVEGMRARFGWRRTRSAEHDRRALRTMSHFDSIGPGYAVIQSGMEKGAAEMWDRLENLLSTLQ